ncbi:MAG: phosphatase PAP2 family protein [Hyphomicrobiaceae bacterium]
MKQATRCEKLPVELGILLALGLLVVTLGVFLLIAIWVSQGRLVAVDRLLLLSLRVPGHPQDPLGPIWFESFVRDVTALGSRGVLGLVVVAVAGFLALTGRGGRALAVLAFTITGSLVGEIAKHAFARPRPDLVPHGVEVMSLSFPSAHAMQASVVYLTLGALLAASQPQRRVRAYVVGVAVLVVLTVGTSRVYLGVHWPSDVLAGWALGTAWATVCWLVDRRMQHRAL